jgi:AraC-like DNA-binding protein
MAHSESNIVSFAAPGDPQSLAEQRELDRLAMLIERYAPHDGRFNLSVPGIQVVKSTRPDSQAKRSISCAGMCIVPQGAKRVTLGKAVYEYDESRMVIYSSEVPIAASIIKASKAEPYLALVFEFDPQRLSALVLKTFPQGAPKNPDMQPIYVGKSNPKIIKSAIRLMELINQQEDLDLLAPLVIDEIMIRLLRSPVGACIAQIGVADSNAHKVAKAICWLKANYTDVMKVEELAERAGMSPSSFYQHFKSITSLSPLQYQKVLRLQEARNLMMFGTTDVSTVAMQVGYASVSQFSREYTRLFGNSPSKDAAKLREQSA